MEAMACGKPVIGTRWSGNTAFMTEENSYLVDCTVVPVPEEGWREIPTYRGHRWAEPDRAHLRHILQRVVAERGEAQEKGRRAQEQIAACYDRVVVGRQVAEEIARLQEERRPHPVLVLV
jgi:glycosyltransferase involved in cell wall biosynthesis